MDYGILGYLNLSLKGLIFFFKGFLLMCCSQLTYKLGSFANYQVVQCRILSRFLGMSWSQKKT